MSTPRTVIFNQDEQWSSSDQNNAQGFAGQEFSDVLARLFAPGQNASSTAGALAGLGLGSLNGGVLTGFDPIAAASGVAITVNPGLAFRVNSNPPALGSATQSPWRWIKSTAQVSVVFTPQSSAQIALVYATDATSQGPAGGTSRNIWNSILNTVQAVTLFKELDPSFGNGAGVQGSFGVAYSATNTLPVLPSGCIPIAYVYLAANQTGPIPASQISDCRQLLAPGAFGASGTLGGLHLSYGSSANILTLFTGFGLASGSPIRLSKGDSGGSYLLCNFNTGAGLLLDGSAQGIGASGAPSNVFYCYAVSSAVGGLPIGNVAVTDAGYSAANGNTKLLVTKTVPPSRNGTLSSAVVVQGSSNSFGSGAGPGVTIPAGAGIFVGSICTDASSNIIPFQRLGDRVMLNPLTTRISGPPFFNPGGGYAAGSFTMNNSAPAAGATSIGFGSGGTAPLALPVSASAMIADVIFYYTISIAASSNYELGVMDGSQSTSLSGGTFTETGHVSTFVQVSGVTVSATLRTDVILDLFSKAWAVSVAAASAGTLNFTVIYRGYVESVPHLGNGD